jgi:hypothetical protein
MFDNRNFLDDFLLVYSRRPYGLNPGGIGLNQAFGLYSALRQLAPTTVIESGVWMGWSTWIIQQALPQAQIYCLDPRLERRQFISERAQYSAVDFRDFDWSGIEKEETVIFFDDHQNQVARLQQMIWHGFSDAIFDDNYRSGEGDLYSLRKALDGTGQPNMQMTRRLRKTGLHGLFRRMEHFFLTHHYASQHRIVRPNATDGKNMRAWLAKYEALPSLIPSSGLGAEEFTAAGTSSTTKGDKFHLPPTVGEGESRGRFRGEEITESNLAYVRLRAIRADTN